MTTMPYRLLMFSLVTLIAFCAGTDGSTSSAAHVYQSECAEVKPLISKLRSDDETEREAARKSLVQLAGQSASLRQCVLNPLLQIAAARDRTFDFFKSPELYAEWRGAIDILDTMRAPEAIDTLIDCLECNDGKSSLSLGHFPAALVVLKFGDEAIPKLAEALKHKPPSTRYMAAKVLYVMGSDKAKEVLEKAIRREKVKWIADSMKNMLLTWPGAH